MSRPPSYLIVSGMLRLFGLFPRTAHFLFLRLSGRGLSGLIGVLLIAVLLPADHACRSHGAQNEHLNQVARDASEPPYALPPPVFQNFNHSLSYHKTSDLSRLIPA